VVTRPGRRGRAWPVRTPGSPAAGRSRRLYPPYCGSGLLPDARTIPPRRGQVRGRRLRAARRLPDRGGAGRGIAARLPRGCRRIHGGCRVLGGRVAQRNGLHGLTTSRPGHGGEHIMERDGGEPAGVVRHRGGDDQLAAVHESAAAVVDNDRLHPEGVGILSPGQRPGSQPRATPWFSAQGNALVLSNALDSWTPTVPSLKGWDRAGLRLNPTRSVRPTRPRAGGASRGIRPGTSASGGVPPGSRCTPSPGERSTG